MTRATLRLSDAGVLSAWEDGIERPAVERALALLRHAGVDGEAAAEWPLGQRDARLLEVHSATFADAITAAARCAGCGERLEIALGAAALRTSHARPGERYEVLVPHLDERMVVRPPTSADLRVASACTALSEARRAIARRCIVSAERGGRAIDPDELGDDALAALGEAMSAHDAQADVRLDVTCPVCGAQDELDLDVAAFVWDEVAARARRLIADVHVLAAAYGWTEADVLALPEARRRAYLEMVMG